MSKKVLTVLILALGLVAFSSPKKPKTVYDFNVQTVDGEATTLRPYKGKVLLIVNVASKCGLTPQYADLQALYDKYKDRGLEILAFPANNFLAQEPGSNSEIKQFCQSNYQVNFPIFAKISVKGKDMHPLYRYLTKKSENGRLDAPVTWNFQKFLINRQGEVLESFSPRTKVTEASVLAAIEQALKAS